MKCHHCGYELSAFDVTCPKCGNARNLPRPPHGNAPTVPLSSALHPSPASINTNSASNDSVFMIVGFFVPIAGFILWAITKSENPQKSNSALKGAAWGVGSTFLIALLTITTLTVLGRRISNTFNAAQTQIEQNSPRSSTVPKFVPDANKANYEATLPAIISTELRSQRNINIACTKVMLSDSSTGEYKGVAYFADGSSAPISVTNTPNGPYWQILPQ